MPDNNKTSRSLFREFLNERGLFGYHKVKDDSKDESKKDINNTTGLPGESQDKKSTEDASRHSKENTGPQRRPVGAKCNGAPSSRAKTGWSRHSEAKTGAKTNTGRKSLFHYFRRYLEDVKGQLTLVGVLVFLGFVQTLFHAAIPLAGKYIIDTVIPGGRVWLLFIVCIGMLAAAAGELALGFITEFLSHKATGSVTNRIRRRLMRHAQKLSLARLQELKVGGVISRVQSDTEAMAQLLQNGLLGPSRAAIMLSVGIGILYFINTNMAFIYIIFCIFLAVVAFFFFNIMRPLQKNIREDIADIQARLTEVFSGIQIVRAFGREISELKRYTTRIHYLWRKGLHASVLNIGAHRVTWGIYWLLIITIWFAGGWQVVQGAMTLGDLIVFLFFAEFIFDPVFIMLHSIASLQSGIAGAERAYDMLDEDVNSEKKGGGVSYSGLTGDISLESVSFTYPDGTRALSDLNLVICKNTTTAVVGPSGAGKSTLSYLLMRFYEPSEGHIIINGSDICDLNMASYRAGIGLVLQEDLLFDGSVKENVAYGKPGATSEEIQEAMEVSNSLEFVNELKDKEDTLIGEKGVKLSGGQKQRIALARAVLRKPGILILDEATSNLDSESEGRIQEALERILKERTALVIAHRLSTILNADSIIVLDKGKFVEQGTHKALLEKKGMYHRMYTWQIKKAREAKDVIDWGTTNSGRQDL